MSSHVQRSVAGVAGARSLADQAIACVHRRIRANLTPSRIAADLYASLRTLERGLAATLEGGPVEGLGVDARRGEGRQHGQGAQQPPARRHRSTHGLCADAGVKGEPSNCRLPHACQYAGPD